MHADELSLTFAALADPTRRGILARLAEGEATVNQLAEPFQLKLPTVSKHLKVLQRAGLQKRRGAPAASSRPRSVRSPTGSTATSGSGPSDTASSMPT